MKKLAGILILILLVVFAVYLAVETASIVSFRNALAEKDTGSCIRYYEGISKGIYQGNGEWHHYVKLNIRSNIALVRLQIVEAPLISEVTKKTFEGGKYETRILYRWPFNWPDPFPPEAWRICLLEK